MCFHLCKVGNMQDLSMEGEVRMVVPLRADSEVIERGVRGAPGCWSAASWPAGLLHMCAHFVTIHWTPSSFTMCVLFCMSVILKKKTLNSSIGLLSDL